MKKDKEKEPEATAIVSSSELSSDNNNLQFNSTPNADTCQEAATQKLHKEYKECEKNLDRYGKVIGMPVLDALCNFCKQNNEFSQAVVQNQKTIGDCIKEVSKGIGSAISDLEVYKRAVAFYFKGATVHMVLTVDLGDEGYSNNPADDKPPITVTTNKVELSLDSLIDF